LRNTSTIFKSRKLAHAQCFSRSDRTVVGYVTVNWQPEYPPFRQAGISEIQDLSVLADYRRQAIATKLMNEAEHLILECSAIIGIGAGLCCDYGAAQRPYVKRGYVPDAQSITSHGRCVVWGNDVRGSDDLVLWFTKMAS
jgi:GNAT superfamily N-acetyltransferase